MNGLSDFAAARSQELISFRRDLHAHPELSSQETRTTAAIVRRLQVAGLEPKVLNCGTGLVCDVGTGDGPVLAPRGHRRACHGRRMPHPVPLPHRGSRTRLWPRCAHHDRAGGRAVLR